MLSRVVLALLVLGSLEDCSSPAPATDAGVDVFTYHRPTVPAGGLIVETPPFRVPAGQEVLYCYFSPVTVDHDYLTNTVHSYQFPGGHHALLGYAPTPRPSTAPHPCTDEEMTALRIVGAGTESNEDVLRLPADTAVRIPAGSQLIAQLHYINLTTSDLMVQDAVVALPSDPAAIHNIADSWAISDGDMMIPPHSMYGQTLECTVDRTMTVVSMIGHTHQWGAHLSVVLYPSGSNTPRVLYDQPAGMRLQFNPPNVTFPPPDTLTLHPGDRVRLVCDWNNTSSNTLAFPVEMCAMFGYYYPGQGFYVCGQVIETRGAVDAGIASTDGNAGCTQPPGPTDACTRACNTGNELGVGKFCTPGGTECRGNHSAIFCTADVDPTAPAFCTRACSNDSACGSGAVCRGDSSGMGCVPIECAGSNTDGGLDAHAMDATVMDVGPTG